MQDERSEEPGRTREPPEAEVRPANPEPGYVEPVYGDVVPGWTVIVRRGVYYVLGIVEVLLVFRFLLRLFAANPAAPFVAFVYGVTAPLVFPFAGVFRGFAADGAAFEPGTLLAMAVYAVAAWAVDRLVMLVASSARGV